MAGRVHHRYLERAHLLGSLVGAPVVHLVGVPVGCLNGGTLEGSRNRLEAVGKKDERLLLDVQKK